MRVIQFLASRRRLLAGIIAGMVVMAGCGGGDNERATQATWKTGNWDVSAPTLQNSAVPAPQYFENETLRMGMRTSAAGSEVRLQLSNEYGTAPLVIDKTRIAVSAGPGSSGIVNGTDTAITFSGAQSIEVPPGAVIYSDFVKLPLKALTDVAISMYFPKKTQLTTHHPETYSTNYVTAGDQASSESMPNSRSVRPWYFLRSIELKTDNATRTIVGIGDSIIQGGNVATDSNKRYMNVLSARVLADPSLSGSSVVNVGIGAGRMLTDRQGPSVINRFDRDVLSTPGVTHVIIAIGVNDIGFGLNSFSSDPVLRPTTAADLQQGYTSLVNRAKAAGVKPILLTITPFEGARYWTAEKELVRQAVNTWIRGNSVGAAGVIDAAAAVADPVAPTKYRSGFTSDNLHPNDAGHTALGESIDLSIFR